MATERKPITVRFDNDVLEAARRHAELSNPPISLNAAVNLLVAAGTQVLSPVRMDEVMTLRQALKVIDKISKRLDTGETIG